MGAGKRTKSVFDEVSRGDDTHHKLAHSRSTGMQSDRLSTEFCSVTYIPEQSSVMVKMEVAYNKHTEKDPLHNGSNSETEMRRSLIRGGTGRAGGMTTSS